MAESRRRMTPSAPKTGYKPANKGGGRYSKGGKIKRNGCK